MTRIALSFICEPGHDDIEAGAELPVGTHFGGGARDLDQVREAFGRERLGPLHIRVRAVVLGRQRIGELRLRQPHDKARDGAEGDQQVDAGAAAPTRYESAYLFGAVCPERAVGAALVMPYADSEAMNLHLQEIGRAVTPGAHAILVLDGAGWHTSHTLDPPHNVTLLCLPPYSPELNPVENVWEYALLLSPLFGFCAAASLFLLLKFAVRNPALYEAPKGNAPPPWWIRGVLILTCTGVSFAHGSNDGQKGMGLIMLILIGTVPTAYALNRSMPVSQLEEFQKASIAAAQVIQQKAEGHSILGNPRPAVTVYVSQRKINEGTYPSLAVLVRDISSQVTEYGSLAKVPAAAVGNTRNDMYLVSEAIRFLMKDKENDLTKDDVAKLNAYKKSLDNSTRFIPLWVKIAVAVALGLGTMIGWKRIVITVGEKIGKSHMTYAQGASAEIVAMGTIGAADIFGLPVSTTHVLSSGVAGTMAANGSGLQWETIRNLAMAWVLTLPMAMMLSGGLFVLFVNIF